MLGDEKGWSWGIAASGSSATSALWPPPFFHWGWTRIYHQIRLPNFSFYHVTPELKSSRENSIFKTGCPCFVSSVIKIFDYSVIYLDCWVLRSSLKYSTRGRCLPSFTLLAACSGVPHCLQVSLETSCTKKFQGFPLKNGSRHPYNLIFSLEGANCVSSTLVYVCAMSPQYRKLYFPISSKEKPMLNILLDPSSCVSPLPPQCPWSLRLTHYILNARSHI